MSIIEKFETGLIRDSLAETPLTNLFTPITLEALNQKAAMLTRLDNKYIVREAVLKNVLPTLAEHFDILEIEQKRLFTYDTCYFDDEKLSCYFNHHNGRRQRIKVRTRKYDDTDLCFVEAKIKDIRGVTVKKRLAYPMNKHGRIDTQAQHYIEKVYRDFYDKDFSLDLKPQLTMSYKRMTLVAKNGGERLTLDSHIRFGKGTDTVTLSPDIYIIETKSRNANGHADAILRSFHQHPTKRCSKYCIGLCVTQQVQRINNFMPALRKLGVLNSANSYPTLELQHL